MTETQGKREWSVTGNPIKDTSPQKRHIVFLPVCFYFHFRGFERSFVYFSTAFIFRDREKEHKVGWGGEWGGS